MIHLLHYGEDLCLSWCRGHRHRLIVFSCSATTSCSGVCRLVQMTKGMGWECVVKWHRVAKSENNIKRLEMKANIMNNKWAQGKEKWWVMGLKEFVIIINNFFFQDMTPWHCLWCCENTNLHALTCLMAQWTIKRWSTLCAYKVSYHRNCLGHLPQLVMLYCQIYLLVLVAEETTTMTPLYTRLPSLYSETVVVVQTCMSEQN